MRQRLRDQNGRQRVKTETIEYRDGDVSLRGYAGYGEKGGKRAGVR
jgi:hypothetical protein